MWDTIKFVTTPIGLLAFVAAIVAYIYRLRATSVRSLIEQAPDSQRSLLIQSALRDFKLVDTGGLTQKQQYEIVLRTLEHKERKLRHAGTFSIILASIICFAAVLLSLADKYVVASKRSVDSSSASLNAPAITYDSIEVFGLQFRKPVNWFATSSSEGLTAILKNPVDPGVHVTLTPMSLDDYQQSGAPKCREVEHLKTGGHGPESDGLASLNACLTEYDEGLSEELALEVSGKTGSLLLICGYAIEKKAIYSDVCRTIVGSAKYVGH